MSAHTDRNKQSLSPTSRMKKRGEEFLKKIETLKDKIQLEGKQIQSMKEDLNQERRAIL